MSDDITKTQAREHLEIVVKMAHGDVINKIEREWEKYNFLPASTVYAIIQSMQGEPWISVRRDYHNLAVIIAQYSDVPSVRDALIEFFEADGGDWGEAT